MKPNYTDYLIAYDDSGRHQLYEGYPDNLKKIGKPANKVRLCRGVGFFLDYFGVDLHIENRVVIPSRYK